MESSVRCDLCEKLCHGPIRYAHKPYAFRFYNEHRRAVEKFNNQTKMQKQEEEKSGHQDVVLDDKWTVTETESEHEDAKMVNMFLYKHHLYKHREPQMKVTGAYRKSV